MGPISNRYTRLVGIEHPIVQEGLGPFRTPKLAAVEALCLNNATAPRASKTNRGILSERGAEAGGAGAGG